MKKYSIFTQRQIWLSVITIAFLIGANIKSYSQWISLDTPETSCSVSVSEDTVGTGSGVVVFLTTTSNDVYYNTFNIINDTLVPTSSWQEATFPGAVPRDLFDSPVTFTILNGELYVFGRIRQFGNPSFNKDLPANTIFWAHTIDGQNHWTDWVPLPSGGSTDETMKALTYKDAIFLFSKGVGDGRIYQNVFYNNVWSGWSLVGDSNVFSEGVTATVSSDRLYLYGISNDHSAMMTSARIRPDYTTDWSIWETVPGDGERFFSEITATNYSDKQIQLFGIKYNDVQHGIGIIENDYNIPKLGQSSDLRIPKWTKWHSPLPEEEEDKDIYYYHTPAMPDEITPHYKKVIFTVANHKLYYRYL